MSDNFSKILEALQEPFPSAYIEWKPQSVSKDGKRAIAAAYVDARRYQERLDQVCPGWSSKIELLANGTVAKVSITIEGVTREDVGEASSEDANTVTTAVAQAFKRACAAFGLGRYLYYLPLTWCDYDPEKKRIITPPQLPDWAKPSSERQAASFEAARQRVAAEMPAPETPTADEALSRLGFQNGADDVANFVVPEGFKKYGGMRLSELPRNALEWYANSMEAKTPAGKSLQAAARAYLAKHPVS